MNDEFAKELARQLPVKDIYADAGKAAARQAGQLFEDIVKTLQLALAPLQVVGAYQDRFREFLDRSVRRVPEDQRISPAPQILGPVLEGVRYEPEGTPIDEMFSQLLSCCMDSGRVDKAHPSYPIIIKQLSSDEAKVLKSLRNAKYRFVRVHHFKDGMSYAGDIEVDELPRDTLQFPGNVSFYMAHLRRLGLASLYETRPQQPIFVDGHQTGTRTFSEYRLSDVGRRFIEACIPA